MKYSYNWLKKLSGTKKSAEEIAELFLTHSFEVEGIEDLSKNLDKVVVGEVLSVEKHPDADKLSLANVNVGNENGGELQIVCGAPNLAVGQKVPVALVGAKLPDGDDFFKIKKSKIRGAESNGMICAEDELGLGEDHKGIMVLGDDAEVGQSLAEYLHLNDKILDIDILPNRGHDCLGYNGVARELNALENSKFKIQNFQSIFNDLISKFKNSGNLAVKIDTDNCSRYAGVRIKNIEIKPSPIWMQARLKASGLKPINNVVDITNYVMLETGQPPHAFTASQSRTDADLTQTNADGTRTNAELRTDTEIDKIVVRQAEEGEKIKLLDEQELELCQDDIVITDGKKPIALAGVMGGLESGINDNTSEIILEGANFNSSTIRFTARRYNLQTDAAYRFERDIDPNFVDIALARAVELIKELAGGEVVAVNDVYPEPIKPWTIKLDTDYVRSLLGVEIDDEEITSILKRLGVGIKNPKSETLNPKQIQNSNQKISNVVLVHGCGDNQKDLEYSKRQWQPWIKQKIESKNIKVNFPTMPNSLTPVYEDYKMEFEKIDINENSILIGHSCGANFLVRWLSETNTKIKKLIMVAPWNEPNHENKVKAEFYNISDVNYSFVKNIQDGVVIFTSDNEEVVGKNTAKLWTEKLNAKLIELKKHGNYTESGMGTTEFPELLDEILEIQNSKFNQNSKLKTQNLLCTVPTRRRDLRTQEDLIEEVGRIYGYDKIKPVALREAVQTPHRNEQRFLERRLKEVAVQSGFSEIRSYSFYSRKDLEAIGLGNIPHLELLNPASPEQQAMRDTLVPSLLKAGRKNLSHFKEVRIFEVGRVYKKFNETLPEEKVYLGGAVLTKDNKGEQFYELKGLVDNLLEAFGISDYYYDDEFSEEESGKLPNLHPSRRALIKNSAGEVLGYLGEVDKKTAKHFGLKNVRGAVAELDVEKLHREIQEVTAFEALAKFPFVERDLSMIVPEKLRVKEVEDVLYQAGQPLLQDVDLFDLYQNKETGERSMAFHLVFGDKERTLQSKEIDEKIDEIIETVEDKLGVEVRK